MKKRLFVLVVVITLLLSGCCSTCDNQVEQLNKRITELENQLAAITVTAPTEPVSVETEPIVESTSTEQPAPTEPTSDESNDMSIFLDNLLVSDKYADWLIVANCEKATLDHLLRCAKKCASISNSSDWAYNIANELVTHPNATGEVVEELCNSEYYRVWYRIAYADCNDADSLVAVAKKSASISNSSNWAYDIANELVSHPNATGEVVEELCNSTYYRVWYRIAYADCNDADSLVAVAKKCASISSSSDWAYDIANELVSHPDFTANVAIELSNSDYTSVKNLAHQELESLEKT